MPLLLNTPNPKLEALDVIFKLRACHQAQSQSKAKGVRFDDFDLIALSNSLVVRIDRQMQVDILFNCEGEHDYTEDAFACLLDTLPRHAKTVVIGSPSDPKSFDSVMMLGAALKRPRAYEEVRYAFNSCNPIALLTWDILVCAMKHKLACFHFYDDEPEFEIYLDGGITIIYSAFCGEWTVKAHVFVQNIDAPNQAAFLADLIDLLPLRTEWMLTKEHQDVMAALALKRQRYDDGAGLINANHIEINESDAQEWVAETTEAFDAHNLDELASLGEIDHGIRQILHLA